MSDRTLKIGVSLGGSLGDICNASGITHGLRSVFPQSHITFFLFKGAEILKGNETVDLIRAIPASFEQTISNQTKNFDIFCSIRYPVKYYFSESALLIPKIAEFKERWETKFKQKYEYLYEEFLKDIPRLNKFCKDNNMTVYDVRRDSSCLDYTDDDQFISVTSEDFKASESLNNLRIVCVNNSGIIGTMTKSWGLGSWLEITKYLKKRGLYVVQLGVRGEPDIPGVNERFYGTIHQTAAVIKRAKFNVFIEGGLVHIAKAVGKKSVVLFGPTPTYVFGYKDNINLKGNLCSPCWHPQQGIYDWNKFCVKTGIEAAKETPECMSSLSPSSVIDAIDEMLVDTGILTKEGIKNA